MLWSLLCMALAVATPGHGHGSHEDVFFLIVMFCVQPCSRHCARPTLRQRSSSGNCGSMVCGCGNDKVQSPELLPLRDCGRHSFFKATGDGQDHQDFGRASRSDHQGSVQVGGFTKVSSRATNSYQPAFSSGVTIWDGLLAPPAGNAWLNM